MASLYLQKLSDKDRKALVGRLHESQRGHCFICEKEISLSLHKDVDIDHVQPLSARGKDDESNFALTHSSCNRSKQASNLQVARILQRFSRLKELLAAQNRDPNLGDVLAQAGGGNCSLSFALEGNVIRYVFSEMGDETVRTSSVHDDPLSGFRYFFAELPIRYLAHDEQINPRGIGKNIGRLVEEFHDRFPQLHVPLAWIASTDGRCAVNVFDGQHKAAAQVMLGAKALPVRVFIDPDIGKLTTANVHAGTTLRQVAFDKSVQRHLGSTQYNDRLQRYRRERGLAEDDFSFSEQDLVGHFRGQSREVKRFVLDAVRDAVTSSPDNKLRDFIDNGGRGKERPLSYSTVDKTFNSFFVHQGVLSTPLGKGMDTGENPRELEVAQIVRLMNIIAEEIYIGQFDLDVGTDKIESKLQKGEPIRNDHLRAFRMSKEEIIYNWLRYVQQVIRNYFITTGMPIQEDKLFQYPFNDQLWTNIRNFIRNLAGLPLWINKDLSETVFGGKQNNSFWQTVFETGKSPQGVDVMPKPINLVAMIGAS